MNPTALATWPRERLEAALAHPSNASPAVQRALRDALGRQAPSTSPPAVEGARGRRESAGGARKRRGRINALERRFAVEVLDPMVALGELDRYEFEGLTLHEHASGSKCTPDFVGWRGGTPALFECKGAVVHEASVLRMKLHAAARPWLRWRIYAKRRGEGWRVHFDSGERTT